MGNIKEVIATAYLSTSHQISATSDDRDRILLNRGGAGVMSVANVLQEDGVEGRAREAVDWLRNAGTGGFDGNIVVFFKVDTGVLLGRVSDVTEEFLLHAIVAASNDMNTVAPGAIAETLARAVVSGGSADGIASRSSPAIDTLAGTTVKARSCPIAITGSSSVPATDGGSRGAGLVPAGPEGG